MNVIDRREILDLAATFGLPPNVVEKDYVLGWLLWGIYNQPELADNWVFKGGTCLKKCFFETYRFSEDLDFTLRDEMHIDRHFLEATFRQICDNIYQESGIEFPPDMLRFDLYDNRRGNPACEGRVGYRGPISPPGRNAPRLKLDLTADETIVSATPTLTVFHPYTDAPDGGISVVAYCYEEAFAEKVRALAERTRPRDLYDVIHLYRNAEARPRNSVLADTLDRKCRFKGIDTPKLRDLEPYKADLEGSWTNMLAHQLPELPSLDIFWNVLPDFFAWLAGESGPVDVPAPVSMETGEEVIRDRLLHVRAGSGSTKPLEVIRFAAANRLCVELDYHNSTRLIEPYSLRRTQAGDVILHAHNVDRNEHRSYRIDRIQGARSTNRTFIPRHQIELTPTGPVPIPHTSMSATQTPSRVRRRSAVVGGPTYIYECTSCGKSFRRKRQSTRLRKHNDKDGYPCWGRFAYLKDIRQ